MRPVKMYKMKAILFSLLIASGNFSVGQTAATMRYEDKIRIREAIQISKQSGEKIWKGFNKVPFVILLVSEKNEFLINHPDPGSDFRLSEADTILKTNIYYRPKQFPESLLATFPAVNGVNCIVVGTPERTGKPSGDWIITLLHEHFHQFQFTQKDYYTEVEKLGLAKGDTTGMWQINYAFPYEDKAIAMQYSIYKRALYDALINRDKRVFKTMFRNFMTEKKKFKGLLEQNDYRYFSFQLWQEGIARYTEYEFLQVMENYEPSAEVKLLSDFTSFSRYRDEFYSKETAALLNSELDRGKRLCFYSAGFAEGILLDYVSKTWKQKYLTRKFTIDLF